MQSSSSSPSTPVFSPVFPLTSRKSTVSTAISSSKQILHPPVKLSESIRTKSNWPQKALQHLKQLWQFFGKPNPLKTTQQHFRYGQKLERQGHYQEAEKAYRQALTLALQAGKHHHFVTYALYKTLADIYITLANTDHTQSDYYFQKAEVVLRELRDTQEFNSVGKAHIAQTNLALGKVCQAANKPEKASEYFQEALAYYEQVNRRKEIQRIHNALRQLETPYPLASATRLAQLSSSDAF